MALNINGTTGISGVDGSASAASIAGTDANTGLSFASDTVNINTGGVTRATVDSSGNVTCSNDLSVDNDLKADSGFGSTTTIYGVRAWANFDGSGTVASNFNGGNVTSMTDLGEGQYRVTFTTAMPDTNYCMVAGSSNGATSIRINCQQAKTTALYEFKTNDHGANTYDAANGQIAFIR